MHAALAAGPRFDAELLELSELDADPFVVGRRGRGGFVEMLVGSVLHRLARRAELPLVMVPAGKQSVGD
jgi:nucleotide-binding universal stress UspA family protein